MKREWGSLPYVIRRLRKKKSSVKKGKRFPAISGYLNAAWPFILGPRRFLWSLLTSSLNLLILTCSRLLKSLFSIQTGSFYKIGLWKCSFLIVQQYSLNCLLWDLLEVLMQLQWVSPFFQFCIYFLITMNLYFIAKLWFWLKNLRITSAVAMGNMLWDNFVFNVKD